MMMRPARSTNPLAPKKENAGIDTKKLIAPWSLCTGRDGCTIRLYISDCIQSRTPYKPANQAKKESSRSNLLRMSENPIATKQIEIDAAAIKSCSSLLRKASKMSAELCCIFHLTIEIN